MYKLEIVVDLNENKLRYRNIDKFTISTSFKQDLVISSNHFPYLV